MKIRLLSAILAVAVIVIASCSNGGGGEQKEATLLTLNEVTQALEAQGAELFHIGRSEDDEFVLNGVKPDAFTIGRPTEDVARLENIYMYFFDSEQERADGVALFEQRLELMNLATFPFAYGHKNALLIYFAERAKHPKFGELITTALQTLS